MFDRDRIRVAVEAAASVYQPSESRADAAGAPRRAGVPVGRRGSPTSAASTAQARRHDRSRPRTARARRRRSAAVLVLVGALDDDPFFGSQQRIRDAITRCGTDRPRRWAGFVPDDELRHLLSGTLALVLPSESEGFGLPAVEAAACGIPVIATTESPLPQLLEGGGIFVAPGDDASSAAAWAAGDDERTALRSPRAPCPRARALSWTASARSALAALTEAAA